MPEQPESPHVERLTKALEESRRVEKELDARDLREDAQFGDRLAARLEQNGDGAAPA